METISKWAVSRYADIGAVIAAKLTISFLFGVGAISALKVVNDFIGILTSDK